VQYRNPIRSIVSDYHVYRAKRPGHSTLEHWKKYAYRLIRYWNRFIDECVLDFPANRGPVLYCTYEELLADPESRVRDVLSSASPDPIDQGAMASAITRVDIKRRDSLATFEFYDAGFLEEIEATAEERLRRLNLPSFRNGVEL